MKRTPSSATPYFAHITLICPTQELNDAATTGPNDGKTKVIDHQNSEVPIPAGDYPTGGQAYQKE